jgi:ribosomal protein S18 acetylase RimI-like enzyme
MDEIKSGKAPLQRTAAGIRFRFVPAHQSAQLLSLHRKVFDAGEVGRTIYGATRVSRYLETILARPGNQDEHEVWGAWDGDRLVGYAHCRALEESWHLNNVAVLPEYQGMGIASLFWTLFLSGARERGYHWLTLDVEQDNEPVVAWYLQQGMERTQSTWRYEKRLRPEGGARALAAMRFLDWENAEAWEMAYGFSRFQLQYDGQTWPIARPNFRYYSAQTPLPGAVEAALAALDPERHLLLLLAEPVQDPALVERGVTLRLCGLLEGMEGTS